MTATDHAIELVQVAAAAAADKLAQQVIAYDVSEQLAITDAFVLASASNERQVKAIVDEVEDKLREAGTKPIRREGHREGRWVLLDYGEIVVHVQHEEERQFYALERLWRDCPVISVDVTTPPVTEVPGAAHAGTTDADPEASTDADPDAGAADEE
jgi:ribosome-associated protein